MQLTSDELAHIETAANSDTVKGNRYIELDTGAVNR